MIFTRTIIATVLGLSNLLLLFIDYFRFVHYRKPDRRFGLLPGIQITILLAISISASVLIVHFAIDPLFIEWYRGGNAHKDGIFATTTKIGRSTWILYVTGFAAVLFSMLGLYGAAPHYKVHWHHIFLKIYFVFTSVGFSGLMVIGFKALIGRARPITTEADALWTSSPFTDPYFYASFPSGHSTTVGSLGMALFLLQPRWGLYFVPIAIWVGTSRSMVGAHFPSDAAAGLAFGALFAWVYARLFARKRLLFAFGEEGKLVLRRKPAKQARRKIRKGGRRGRGRFFVKHLETDNGKTERATGERAARNTKTVIGSSGMDEPSVDKAPKQRPSIDGPAMDKVRG